MIYTSEYISPMGGILLAADEIGSLQGLQGSPAEPSGPRCLLPEHLLLGLVLRRLCLLLLLLPHR